MKRVLGCILFLSVLSLCCGCHAENETADSSERTFKHIEPVGELPAKFAAIVENNLFCSAVSFSDRLLKWNMSDADFSVSMYDFYGELMGEYSGVSDISSYQIKSPTATADGGFLFALGFLDRVNPNGGWDSQLGVHSRVIKCDAAGVLEWDVRLADYTGGMLEFCLETDEAYYFFGEIETPETNTAGIHSPTDIHLMKMSKQGQIQKTAVIAGSDYDYLHYAERKEGDFLLSANTQSSDGDFSAAGNWEITVTDDLMISDTQETDWNYRNYIGILNGVSITDNDPFAKNFAAGRLTAILDYGDSYMTVSENITGQYENQPPVISAIWYYTETVYTLFNSDGQILWCAAVDSTPDWDSVAAQYYEENQQFQNSLITGDPY